jgi:hypothetical protein
MIVTLWRCADSTFNFSWPSPATSKKQSALTHRLSGKYQLTFLQFTCARVLKSGSVTARYYRHRTNTFYTRKVLHNFLRFHHIFEHFWFHFSLYLNKTTVNFLLNFLLNFL